MLNDWELGLGIWQKIISLIKALIIDDERRARNILKLLIERHIPAITEIQLAENATEGLRKIRSFKPHLLFLDIEMPLMDGFDLLSELETRDFDLIFTTAYDQYAIQAIKFSALDYLLKPIEVEELKAAVHRFQENIEKAVEKNQLYQNLLQSLNPTEKVKPKLAISTQNGAVFLFLDDIIRCESQSNYTMFYLNNGKKLLASRTLKEYDSILSEYQFLRVHKSHLVNLNFVERYSNDGILHLKGKGQVMVSRRKKILVKSKLGIR